MKPAHVNVKYKKDHFYSRNRKLENRFEEVPKKPIAPNLVIYTKKDSQSRSQQTKIIRESYQKMKNSWQKDLQANSSQHEIIKKIITSTAQESTKTNNFPSENNIMKNYFPVKSLTTHAINNSEVKEGKGKGGPMGENGRLFQTQELSRGKILTRSVPRSPLKQRETSQEVDIYKRDERTGALVKSGKRIVTVVKNKRGK